MDHVAFFSTLFDTESRKQAFVGEDREALIQWQTEARQTLTRLLGIDRIKPIQKAPKVLEKVSCEGYTCERVLLYPEAGEEMPVLVLRPDGLAPGERVPVILAPHGHGFGGKAATAGFTDDPRILEAMEQANADYGRQMVRRGCLVFCPDARGMGERREDTSNPLGQRCHDLSNMAQPMGRTVAGMWVFDLMRLLDYALEDEHADPERVGCVGLSGGGMQTLLLAALDERVRSSVVSGYFYGYKQALLEIYFNCACNYVPGLWECFDMGDIGAMVAPRALAVETGTRDDLNGRDGLDNVLPQVEITGKAYALCGARERLAHFVFEGAHRFDGTQSLDFCIENLNR